MYGLTARQAMRLIVDESNDLVKGPTGRTLKPGERNKLVDRIFFELWMRGYAVSARTPGLRPGFKRDEHDAWRKQRLSLRQGGNQSDVEVQAKKPVQTAGGYEDAPAA